MAQRKASLRAFSYIILGWISLRAVVNISPQLPDFSTETGGTAKASGQTSRTIHVGAIAAKSKVKAIVQRSPLPPLRKNIVRVVSSVGHSDKAPAARHKTVKVAPLEARLVTPEVANGAPVLVTDDAPNPVTSGNWASLPIETPEFQPSYSRNLAVSGWLLLRSGVQNSSIATAGQLAGSQAGVRANIPLKSFKNAVTVLGFARGSSALRPVEQGEAAVGVTLRHEGRITIEAQIERRIKLTRGGRNDFALTGNASVYGVPLSSLVTLEGYAQVGVVGLRKRDLFVDVAARADREILTRDKFSISAGGGVWAAAQPNVHRIDIGPQLTFKPKVNGGGLRISGEWRFRLAGNAEPSSGPTLTAGFDF